MRDQGSSAEPRQADRPLGILAGAGAFPIEIAASLSGRGRRVHLVAIEGFAGDEARRFPHEWVGLGQVARMLASFRRAGCREIVIAGGMRRPDLLRLRPDWGLIRYLPTVLALTRGGDDSVLRRIVRFFEAQGFVVRGAGETAPELLAPPGVIGRHAPSENDQRAIARATEAIAALGGFDIGQAAVATAERVIAIEGVRGTDAMLTTLAEGGAAAGGARGGVLVKLAKPGQELRVDLPAIGPRTIEGAARAGLAGIAVGAGRAIMLERAIMTAAADNAGLFVHGFDSTQTLQLPLMPDLAAMALLAPMARRQPTPSARRDTAIGRQLLHVMALEHLGHAVVIAGEHVLAVSAELDAVAMVRHLGHDAQWGRRWLKRRIGSLVINIGCSGHAAVSQDLFRAAREARLAGVVCVGGVIPGERFFEVAGWADDAGMFLMSEAAADA